MIPLEDGIYDVMVVDASEDAARDEVRVEVTVTSGRHKGEVVGIRASARTFPGDPIALLGQPATLTVADGNPSLRLD
jgi:hypothetical protein